ncbi:hypothetical protein BIZ37_06050 [Photobacterium sp. BZF1]|uniref:type II secretion system protein GspM n=1 Tax=Photobacterium sp. BZF1 TaxID=1904457 RepID=UPI00165364C5|nr:type II secretion system protein GspM [Photobacterium sp. BZF1]MBC7002110.1 hypothetical protein [Photobacterium sp. BZF1]
MQEQLRAFLARVDNELESPIVRWTALLIVICLFYFIVVDPYFNWRAQMQDQIAQSTLQLERQQRVVASLPKLQQLVTQVDEQRNALGGHLLKQTTDSSAQAALMGELNKPIRKHGLRIAGRRFESGEPVPYLGSELSIRLTLTGSTWDIYQFLDEINQSSLLLVIEPLNIRLLQRHTELQLTVKAYRQLPEQELKRLSQQGAS